jgi:hypothetical protein
VGYGMGIKIFWADESCRYLRQMFEQPWTWDDFYSTQSSATNMMNQCSHPIGMTLELSCGETLPPNGMMHLEQFIKHQHPNLYLTTIVSDNASMRQMYSSFIYFHPVAQHQIILAKTLKEAFEMLETLYPKTMRRTVEISRPNEHAAHQTKQLLSQRQ